MWNIAFYPENLSEILKQAILEYAEKNFYVGVDASPVAAFLMEDKKFHALVKDTFWGDEPILKDYRVSQAIGDIVDFLEDRIDDEPQFLVEVGGLRHVTYPDNLCDILIDSVYIVARDYHLPVKNAVDQAEKIMLDPAFQSRFATFPETNHLLEGTDDFQAAVRCCYDFVQDLLVPNRSQKKQTSLDVLLRKAEAQKTPELSKTHIMAHAKEAEDPHL